MEIIGCSLILFPSVLNNFPFWNLFRTVACLEWDSHRHWPNDTTRFPTATKTSTVVQLHRAPAQAPPSGRCGTCPVPLGPGSLGVYGGKGSFTKARQDKHFTERTRLWGNASPREGHTFCSGIPELRGQTVVGDWAFHDLVESSVVHSCPSVLPCLAN